jgi:hypothetical protein
MSTEIKNTLFRFVTMRAPELTTEEGIKTRFVFMEPRKNTSEIRVFEDAVDNKTTEQSKWDAMVELASTYTSKTELEIKNINQKIYAFGVWIAKNKHSLSHQDLLAKAEVILSEKLTVSELNVLWDNLFYQVVTKKDLYAKEAIMHILIGNHILTHNDLYLNDADFAKLIVLTKVVLPKALFVESNGSSNGLYSKFYTNLVEEDSATFQKAYPSIEMKKLREIRNAKTKIGQLNTLKKELQKAEIKFKKEYKEAYKDELAKHQATIEEIKDDYEAAVKDSQEKWCDLQDPNFVYDVNNPCNQPEKVSAPEYPPFVLKFRNEMDVTFLENELSSETFKTLLQLLDIEFTTDISGKVDQESITDLSGEGYSYSQSYLLIDAGISQNNQTITNNTPSQNNVVASVGGVIIPVTTTSTELPFSFLICPFRTADGLMQFDIKIEVPDSTWEIDESNSYHQIMGITSTGTSGLFMASQTGNSILVHTPAIYNYNDSTVATSIEGQIGFSNGVEAVFSVPNSISASFFKSCVRGNLTLLNSIDNNSGDSGENNSITTNFIPSGYGFKQIGIADYKKVEQTTQGYVEGDVAHIENIMAREYKEKATRKLRRSENTTTTSSESEKEKLSDTTTTDRYEMQTEISKIMQEATDFAANAYAQYNGKIGKDNSYSIGGNVSLATHSSNEESTLNAVNQAKEITERAMERIITKVKEERIEKIIEEFEENNKHGYDNTKGDKHVVGVYRWVDKIFKNQVYNYGKRLMFEFMIPQPSKLHVLGMSENRAAITLVEPIDPRKFEDPVGTLPLNHKKLENYGSINEMTAKHWGSVFNVELKPCPALEIKVGKSFAQDSKGGESGFTNSKTDVIKIPEGYVTHSASLYLNNASEMGSSLGYGPGRQNLAIPGKFLYNQLEETQNFSIPNYKDELPVAYFAKALHASSASIEVKCVLSEEAKQKWQQETFKAIIDAYEDALVQYNQKLTEETALGAKIKEENSGFYRQIENTVLRKNCISYMIDQNPNAARTYGKDMFNSLDASVKRTFINHEVNVSAALDDYSAFVKFMEQAFEWEIMSYNFYPYYWGQRKDWSSLYQYDNNDPLFRNFMQAGMARVIVTVRPGFEEAVRFYMQTGEIWNGGEVPIIEDKLFLSLVEELRAPKGKKEGKAWATRLPTALTILQANNIGLNVSQALPYDYDALDEFENPSEVPVSEQLLPNEALLGTSQSGRIAGRIVGNENKEAKITLTTLNDQLKALTYCDAGGNFELNSIPVGTYQLNLDANNDFPTTTHQVTVGSKFQQVSIAADLLTEINMTVAPLN